MEITAQLNYLRISPRKVRLVADLVRGKKVEVALALLDVRVKKASDPIAKLLASAVAGARNNFNLTGDQLFVKKICVNEGPKLKRWRARARGRANPIQKKTSHITITLDQVVSKEVKVKNKTVKKIK